VLDHASLGVENAGHEDEVLVVRRNVQTDLVASDLVQDLGARGLLRQKHVDVVAGILYIFGVERKLLGVDLVDLFTGLDLVLDFLGAFCFLLLGELLGLFRLFDLVFLSSGFGELLLFYRLTLGSQIFAELSSLHVGNVLNQLLTSLVGVVELGFGSAGVAHGVEFLALLVHRNGQFRVLAFATKDELGYKLFQMLV